MFDNFNWGSPDSFGDIPKPGFTWDADYAYGLHPDHETRVQALKAWTLHRYYCEEIIQLSESLAPKWRYFAERELRAAKNAIEKLQNSQEGKQ